MTTIQHDVGVSGGKDSQALLCKAVERAQRRPLGNLPLRAFFCDTGNENQITLDHVAYLSDWLFGQIGVRIETLSGYDVPGLMDAEAFEHKRAMVAVEWSKEKRRKKHVEGCDRKGCDCPVIVSPAVPDHLIAAALELLHPTGIAFLDMAMLHGRFPGVKARFCTSELKLEPLLARKRPLLDQGVNVIDWIGERAAESKARAAKRPIQRIRHPGGGMNVLYRPLFHMSASDVFEISKRHGLRPNPLYTMGFERVGCFPCIMEGKNGLRNLAARFPEEIERLREWERITGIVSRRQNATFFCAKMVPGRGDDRAQIDKAVAWASTSRGGWNYDAFLFAEQEQARKEGWLCESAYGLCE